MLCCPPGDSGFATLVSLAQSLARKTPPVRITVLTSGAQEVTGEEALLPESAVVLGAARVIPQEFPGTVCQAIDVPGAPTPALLDRLLAELAGVLRQPPTVMSPYGSANPSSAVA